MSVIWPEDRQRSVAGAILLPDTCTTPAECDRLMSLREQTWREPRCPNPHRCDYCGGVRQ